MKAPDITFTAQVLGEDKSIEFGINEIGNRYEEDDVFYVNLLSGLSIPCVYSSIEVRPSKRPKFQSAARRYLIDMIEATYPIDSQYEDTSKTGYRISHEAVWNWVISQLPDDWREMPAEALEEYAQACARMEFRDYSEAESDYSKWWEGYKEAKQQQP